jgi:hypothetical protein
VTSSLPFSPSGQVTVAAVNNTSVRQPLPASINQDKQIRVINSTNGIAYARLGGSTVTAANTDIAIPAGGRDTISLGGAETHIAVFLTSGATDGNVFVQRGEGT